MHYIIKGKYNACPVDTLVNTMKYNMCAVDFFFFFAHYAFCFYSIALYEFHPVFIMRITNGSNNNYAQK